MDKETIKYMDVSYTLCDSEGLGIVSDSYDVYYAMNEFYREHSSQGNICADITGGTKAMASSAAIMAAFLGLDIYYVESRYLPLYRRPLPGSEELKALGNPRSIL